MYLTQAQMEQPRAPGELLSWVESKGREMASTREGKTYARSRAPLPKKFCEELRPLALFAAHRYGGRSDVRLLPNLNNEGFDARITVPGEAPAFVEITYAKDGRDEALRFEVLRRDRRVNWLAPITELPPKGRQRRVIIPNDMVPKDNTVRANLNLVASRLRGKANASYGLQYTLIVVVDDYTAFNDRQGVEILDRFVKAQISSIRLDFRELVILGASGRLFLTYGLASARSNQ